MRIAKVKKLISALVYLAAAVLGSAQDSPGLSWKMAVLKWGTPDVTSVPFARPVKMAEGDRFQVYLQTNAPAWGYVLYQSADGSLTVLAQTALKAGKPLVLPSEKETFSLTPPAGTEKIFVVVTAARQPNLEKFLGDPKEPQAILDELARIRQSTSTLAEAPEKPAPMGGVSRGLTPAQATQFEGLSSYVKTIRIEH